MAAATTPAADTKQHTSDHSCEHMQLTPIHTIDIIIYTAMHMGTATTPTADTVYTAAATYTAVASWHQHNHLHSQQWQQYQIWTPEHWPDVDLC